METETKMEVVADTDDQDESYHDSTPQATDTIIDTWLNSAVFITDIDMARETFSVRAYFNLFWRVPDSQSASMQPIIPQLEAFKKQNVLHDTPWIDLLSIKDTETRKWVATTLPVPWLYDLEWMFPNGVRPVHLALAQLFRMKEDIYYIEISMEGTFEETFELNNFPIDFQFLNLQIRFGRQFRFLSTVPQWMHSLKVNPSWCHSEAISCTVLEPAKKEWRLLSPWIDYRINHNMNCKLIRLRVERYAVWCHVM